ncbi:MAG: phosphatidylcholine/phosphatidylserine synthase [Holosporales bacterium]|jgi:CDP-diacylglycerol--serine O-phosphatidyltransferase|nr:phosphatidylcholine/phosphatidylserine synthase [Holosporales bacterium]
MPFKKRASLRSPLLRRKRKRRLKKLSLGRVVPNTITMAALCVSLSGVRFALEERLEYAVICIFVAAILDGMDGRFARLFKCTSPFGTELDSLADIISFGVSPALILYLTVLRELGNFGWSISLFFCACCSLRLARFNTMSAQGGVPPWKAHFFIGVPAPAGALLALSPLIFSFYCSSIWIKNPFFVALIVGGTGLLKISRLPTFSFKKVIIPQRYTLLLLVLTSLTVICLITEIWVTISILTILYLLSIPYSYAVYKRLERQHKTGTKELAARENVKISEKK